MRSATWVLGTLLILPALGAETAPARAASPTQIQEAAHLPAGQQGDTPALRKHFVEPRPGVIVAVTGSRERRLVRYARWIQLLAGDRLSVYEEEGYPSYRHYELDAGRKTEHWTYPEKGITYVFEDGNLLGTKLF